MSGARHAPGRDPPAAAVRATRARPLRLGAAGRRRGHRDAGHRLPGAGGDRPWAGHASPTTCGSSRSGASPAASWASRPALVLCGLAVAAARPAPGCCSAGRCAAARASARRPGWSALWAVPLARRHPAVQPGRLPLRGGRVEHPARRRPVRRRPGRGGGHRGHPRRRAVLARRTPRRTARRSSSRSTGSSALFDEDLARLVALRVLDGARAGRPRLAGGADRPAAGVDPARALWLTVANPLCSARRLRAAQRRADAVFVLGGVWPRRCCGGRTSRSRCCAVGAGVKVMALGVVAVVAITPPGRPAGLRGSASAPGQDGGDRPGRVRAGGDGVRLRLALAGQPVGARAGR